MADAINPPPPPPKQPTTVAMPAVPDWAIELTRSVKEGFTELRTDIQLVATDVTVVKERVRLVEDRVKSVEERQGTNSIRVKDESAVNLKQDAAIALLHTKVDQQGEKVTSIETKTDAQTKMLTAGASFFKDPKVLLVGWVIYQIASGWARKHGLELP